jgi:5-methylcytosine-specific restriction endonuclease McrA
MDAARREWVRQRAEDRCEYCRLRQAHDPYHTFHFEHVVARQHRGPDDLENLAWACHQCNLHKGTNLASFDPDTNEVTRLFHPRRDRGEEHFALDGPRIVGRTAVAGC